MVSYRNLLEAQAALKPIALRTPLLPLKYVPGCEGVFVKCENLQRGGAFKLRGAYNKIRSLAPAKRKKGVVAHSSGNHAQGVAIAAKALRIPATIVTLNGAVPAKVEATRRFGAEVIFGGEASEDIRSLAESISKERGIPMIHPFNDPLIIAGQGSVGLEILDDLPDVKAVVVPVGGGGLCSGICVAIKEANPDVKIFGVEPLGADAMARSIEAGRLVTLPPSDTIADGLKPIRVGEHTFEIVRRYVDGWTVVSNEEILETMRLLIFREKLVVEPSGAAALAAVYHKKLELPEGDIVVVISGGNVDWKLVFPELKTAT